MIALWDTTGNEVVKALASERRNAGGVASGLALTLIASVDERRVREAEAAAATAAQMHPCRLLIVVRSTHPASSSTHPESRLDAEIVVGGRLGPAEAVVLRMHGRLTRHAESGRPRVITRNDGVPLVDAVTASCAVPLSSPPVTIEGHRYLDGGMRSTLNLDLAPGTGPVIALAPSTAAIGPWARIPKQRAALGDGRRVELLYRNAASKRAQGRRVMDRTIVPALVAAAREQGRQEARRVAAALSTTNDA